jgi:glycogen debranching enzyme
LFAGAPRYKTLFGRDSLISAWQMLSIDPSIASATLRVLASYQGRSTDARSEEEPGKILHEHRFDAASRAELPDWKFPYYGSVDSTPLFLIVAGEYVRQTNDLRLLRDLWPAVVAAHQWVQTRADLDGDGFIEYERKNPRGLFHQGWKDGSDDHLGVSPPVALVEVQGYAYAAHQAFAFLAHVLGRDDQVVAVLPAADTLRGRINEEFWMDDRGFFGLALDGKKQLRRAVTSNPGHLLLCKAVESRRLERTINRFFHDDLWTEYGVRTHASSEPDFDALSYHRGTIWPHDNWFLYRGLRALGRVSDARRILEALLRAHEELGKIPELYAVVDGRIVDLSTASPTAKVQANPLQAWSSAGLLDMMSQDEDAEPTP